MLAATLEIIYIPARRYLCTSFMKYIKYMSVLLCVLLSWVAPVTRGVRYRLITPSIQSSTSFSCSVDQFRSRLEAVVTCVNGGDCRGILSLEASMGTGSYVICTCMTDPGLERLGYGSPNLYLRNSDGVFNIGKRYWHYISGYRCPINLPLQFISSHPTHARDRPGCVLVVFVLRLWPKLLSYCHSY